MVHRPPVTFLLGITGENAREILHEKSRSTTSAMIERRGAWSIQTSEAVEESVRAVTKKDKDVQRFAWTSRLVKKERFQP